MYCERNCVRCFKLNLLNIILKFSGLKSIEFEKLRSYIDNLLILKTITIKIEYTRHKYCSLINSSINQLLSYLFHSECLYITPCVLLVTLSMYLYPALLNFVWCIFIIELHCPFSPTAMFEYLRFVPNIVTIDSVSLNHENICFYLHPEYTNAVGNKTSYIILTFKISSTILQ